MSPGSSPIDLFLMDRSSSPGDRYEDWPTHRLIELLCLICRILEQRQPLAGGQPAEESPSWRNRSPARSISSWSDEWWSRHQWWTALFVSPRTTMGEWWTTRLVRPNTIIPKFNCCLKGVQSSWWCRQPRQGCRSDSAICVWLLVPILSGSVLAKQN